jgi:benzoate/toluate 1,2-dioxygenase reductase component
MEGTITGISEEGILLKGFTVKIDTDLAYLPGQYVLLSFPGSEKKRPFSIVDYLPEAREIFFIIKKAGEFTSRLFDSKPGDKVMIAGPYGKFTLPDRDLPLVFVAGGVGITPIYSMILYAKREGRKSPIYLFYSAGKVDEMALFDRILSMKDHNLIVRYFFTKEKTASFINERISAKAIADEVGGLEGQVFYLCGPQAMIDGLSGELMSAGVSRDWIKTEVF